MKYWISLILVFWVVACSQPKKPLQEENYTSDTIKYAQGFSVRHFADYTSVEVRDPWDSTRLLQRYLLVDRNKSIPKALPKGTIVSVPVQNIVVYTAVHAAIIEQLGEVGRVVGVCESRYIDSPSFKEGLKKGQIVDMGEATAPNVELMIEKGAELVFVSPFQNSGYGPVEKLGIPIIEAADYMEALPLGRTEWIRFYGLLFGKKGVADSIFHATEKRYLDLKQLVVEARECPTVFSEKKYGSSWFVAAGESYVANLFKDAGADYIFKDIKGTGSKPLAFETVLDQAIHADIWLVKFNLSKDMSYDDLRMEYAPYENFDAFKKRNIYFCNTGKVPYYEESPLHPDYLLKDLIWIFHPKLLPADYHPRYFRKMA